MRVRVRVRMLLMPVPTLLLMCSAPAARHAVWLGVGVRQPGILLGRYMSRFALTQREMDRQYAAPPDFYLVFRLQLFGKSQPGPEP